MTTKLDTGDIVLHSLSGEFGTVDSIDSHLNTLTFHTNPQRGASKQRKVALSECVYVDTQWSGAWKRLGELGVIDPRIASVQPAFASGKRYVFRDTKDTLHLCEVDAVEGAKVFAYGESCEAHNGWFYVRVDKQREVCAAPAWLQFSREVDCAWIETMRADQVTGCESDNRYNFEKHSAVGKISEELR